MTRTTGAEAMTLYTPEQSARALNEKLGRPMPSDLFREITRREGFTEEAMTLLAYAKSQGWEDDANILHDLVNDSVWRLRRQYDEYEALVGYAIGRKFEQHGSAANRQCASGILTPPRQSRRPR